MSLVIPHIKKSEMETVRIEVPFIEILTATSWNNKNRYPLFVVNDQVEILDVHARLTAFTSTAASSFNFQLVARPEGNYVGGSYVALSAEITSKTAWAGTQTLGILPDAPVELLAASPRLGASNGYGVSTAGSTVSAAILPLPLAKSYDKLTIGFDLGNTATDTLTLRGSLIIIGLFPKAQVYQPTNAKGGNPLYGGLAVDVKKGSVATTGDGAGFYIDPTTGQTAVGTTV
jgi:hypothetical protein